MGWYILIIGEGRQDKNKTIQGLLPHSNLLSLADQCHSQICFVKPRSNLPAQFQLQLKKANLAVLVNKLRLTNVC